MNDFIQSLTCLKSIITLIVTGAFIYLSIRGDIDVDYFKTIYSILISFYFGSQWEKKKNGGDRNV